MNTKVIYCTLSGHSKKIANAIAQRIDAVTYNIKNEHCEVMNEDLLIIISGIYSGVINPALQSWLEQIESEQVKNALIIMSSVTQNYDKVVIKDILNEKGINIIGERSCCGSFLFIKMRHPNKDEIKEITDYAEEIYKSLN